MTEPAYGGDAFPRPMVITANAVMQDAASYGMTLRDYFAAHALLASPPGKPDIPGLALWAYQVADAMLAQRAK